MKWAFLLLLNLGSATAGWAYDDLPPSNCVRREGTVCKINLDEVFREQGTAIAKLLRKGNPPSGFVDTYKSCDRSTVLKAKKEYFVSCNPNLQVRSLRAKKILSLNCSLTYTLDTGKIFFSSCTLLGDNSAKQMNEIAETGTWRDVLPPLTFEYRQPLRP
jgi:hypothetical protein